MRVDAGYHDVLLREIPADCERALDVGCGAGEFARLLAERVPQVDAVDRSAEMITVARQLSMDVSNVRYIEGSVLDVPLESGSYGFISCIAAIHHMPFDEALEGFRSLLAPGGVLAVLGVFRDSTTRDYTWSAVAAPINLARRIMFAVVRAIKGDDRTPTAPRLPPTMTIPAMKKLVERMLPGAKMRRHLLWRYSLVYRKP